MGGLEGNARIERERCIDFQIQIIRADQFLSHATRGSRTWSLTALQISHCTPLTTALNKAFFCS